MTKKRIPLKKTRPQPNPTRPPREPIRNQRKKRFLPLKKTRTPGQIHLWLPRIRRWKMNWIQKDSWTWPDRDGWGKRSLKRVEPTRVGRNAECKLNAKLQVSENVLKYDLYNLCILIAIFSSAVSFQDEVKVGEHDLEFSVQESEVFQSWTQEKSAKLSQILILPMVGHHSPSNRSYKQTWLCLSNYVTWGTQFNTFMVKSLFTF
jgi:hypothetical protein